MKLIYIILFLFTLSCSSNLDNRIELIENELNILIPDKHDVLQDDDVTISVIPNEYDLVLTLGFDEQGMAILERQIKDSPFFNQIGHYKNKEGGNWASEEYAPLRNAKDSLTRTAYRGAWFMTEHGFEFYDLFGPETMQPIEAELDIKERTLMFKFQQI